MAGVTVAFDRAIQEIGPLQEAAYRLIGVASSHIDADGDRWICTLDPAQGIDPEEARRRFQDLVIDENIRARIATSTERVRDLVLSLAFDAVAHKGG